MKYFYNIEGLTDEEMYLFNDYLIATHGGGLHDFPEDWTGERGYQKSHPYITGSRAMFGGNSMPLRGTNYTPAREVLNPIWIS